MRWDGANRPVIWMVPQPDIDPNDARLELARRYLHVLGPGSAESFAAWAGIAPRSGRATFEALAGSLSSVRTPAGRGWILSDDEESFRATHSRDVAPVRLLPSGDTFCLVKDVGRELLVADPDQRRELWPSRVWPGAILVDGDLAGTWRRSGAMVTFHAWLRLAATTRDDIEHEAMSLPLPDLQDRIRVQWMT